MFSDAEKKEALRQSFDSYNVAGYSASPCGANHLLGEGYYHASDVLRGIEGKSSERGLFKENEDLYFWWFDNNGQKIHENICHLNNIGLVSKYDNTLKRKTTNEYRIAVLGCEMTGATTSNNVWPDTLNDFLNSHPLLDGQCQVLNFGHLDTGIHEWKTIWEERASHFDIDLLILNIPVHTFYRKGNVFADVSHWDGLPGFRYVNYQAENGVSATSWIVAPNKKATLSHPDSYTEKLITFWMPREIADNPDYIRQLRKRVINEYVEGANFNKAASSLDPRVGNYPTIPSYSEAERVQWVRDHVTWFAQNVKNVMVTLNPWKPHFIDYGNYLSPDALNNLDPRLEIIDMRKSWKLWGIHDDISALYSDFAAEKWSDEGHRLYGEAVGLEVLYRLGFHDV